MKWLVPGVSWYELLHFLRGYQIYKDEGYNDKFLKSKNTTVNIPIYHFDFEEGGTSEDSDVTEVAQLSRVGGPIIFGVRNGI